MIELRTLGAVDLRASGGGADVRPVLLQQKRLALFLYLAVATPRGFHTRDVLMTLFWPELDAARARNALRQAVFFLRSSLGSDIVTSRGKGDIGLGEGSVWCDAVAFDAAIAADDLQTAVELYQGDFLAGFHAADVANEFEFWVEGERNRRRERAMAAVRALAQREENAGKPQAAAALLRRAMQIDPEDERSLRRLVALLGELGDHAGAHQAYESFRERTLTEYEVPPSPETEAVIRAVREREVPAAERPIAPAAAPLPTPLTPLIGREAEVRTALGFLQRSDVRLLTLTGPGGSGKTRLALEIAARLGAEEGGAVRFVPLASVATADVVIPTIANVVGATAQADATEDLRRFLAQRDMVLVLDNLEHLADVGPELVEILQAAPGVKILTTSRAPLRVRGERTFEVPTLSVPGVGEPTTAETVGKAEAVALFVERARAVNPGFQLTDENAAAVTELCRRIDGLPLAIELAAARTRLFSPQALVGQLARPLAVLREGPRDLPTRHRAIEATIRWSYELLAPQEQALFRRVALFTAGAPLPAVSAMWAESGGTEDEAVSLATALVDQSLLRPEPSPGGETRVGMLETIREFGLERLGEDDDRDSWARWQARYWLTWAEPGQGAYCTLEEPAWFERLDREHDNLRAALGWALEGGDPETALRLGTVLWWYWWVRGHFAEGRRWIERALARSREAEPALRARALLGAAQLAGGQSDQARAIRLMEQSLELQRKMEDVQGTAMVLLNLGYAVREAGELDRAKALFEESLALRRSQEDVRGISLALQGLGSVVLQQGDLAAARRYFEESGQLAQRARHRAGIAQALLNLGDVARLEGREEESEELYGKALERFRDLGQIHAVGQALRRLAGLALHRGQLDRSRDLYVEALDLYRPAGVPDSVAICLIGLTAIASRRGVADGVARLCGGIDAHLEREAVTIPAEDRTTLDAIAAQARAKLGGERFTTAWAEGRALPPDAVVDLARLAGTREAGQRAHRAIG